jgi:outer membrane receptor protein involved in Fe transport
MSCGKGLIARTGFNFFFRVCLLAVFSFAPLAARAEGPGEEAGKAGDSKVYDLQELVVTESKLPQNQENVTQRIEVINQQQIDRTPLGMGNLSELFRYQPGTFVSVLSRNDANWGSYGGLGPKYNGYLLDGLPIDSFVDTQSLDPWILERAEVQRGPASVMYSNYLSMDFAGNQTPLAGITNLVLRDKIDEPMTRFALLGGSFDTLKAKAFHQGNTGDFHYFLGGDFERSSYTNYGTADSWLNMIDNPQYQKVKLYGKTTHFFGDDDHKIYLFGHYTQHTGDAGRPNRDFHHRYTTVNAVYSNPLGASLLGQLKVGYRNYDREWAEDNYPADLALRERGGVDQNIVPMDLAFTYTHWGKSVLTAGMDAQVATYETTSEVGGIESTINDALAYNIGPYAQEKFVLDRWTLRAGVRLNTTKNEYDLISGETPGVSDETWTRPLWSAGVRFAALDWLSLFANGGSSFIVPSAKSVGGTLKPEDAGVPGKNGQLPNPDLDPESGIGADVGAEVFIFRGLHAGVRLFMNEVSDAIVENRVSENPSQSQSVNAGETSTYGVEFDTGQIVNRYVQWFANYTYTNTDVENDIDPDQDGSDVPFVPDHMGNVGFTATFPFGLSISPYVHVVGNYYDSTSVSGRKEFGPYEVISANLQQVVYETPGSSIRLNVDLYNLTDNRYEMPWQFQDTGFSVLGGVVGTF